MLGGGGLAVILCGKFHCEKPLACNLFSFFCDVQFLFSMSVLETNFSEILMESHIKKHLNMLSAICRQFCLGLNVLKFKWILMIVEMITNNP